jgi:TrmH family RNA methyltransferase
VSDLSKNKIKWIRSLHQKKHRDELGLFIVEGDKMVQEALKYSRDSIELLAHLVDFETEEFQGETFQVTQKELEQISTLKTPNKAFAILRQNKTNNPISRDKLIIALDGIQDPGNLGTIMRIADWYGISDIICSTNTVDCYNPKVVQASMGAIFRVKIHYLELEDWLRNCSLPIYGALLEGNNVYDETLVENGILLMGNEGNGISKSLLPLITNAISIPRIGEAESLNVSVATAILVSEFKRKEFYSGKK